jgi:hypothetical protein
MAFMKAIGRNVFHLLNHSLAKVGLHISRINPDLDARLVGARWESFLFKSFATEISVWLASQTLLPAVAPFDIESEVAGFYRDYVESPFRQPFGGSRLNNLLWLDLLAKACAPDLIVDSGTYQGASAWALARGAPHARVLSFDIDQSNIRWRSDRVEFYGQDWTAIDLDLSGKTSLAYFDDHVDQARRLLEAADKGMTLAVFDDDFAVTSFPAMAHDGTSLPKVEFVLDDGLVDGEEITWISKGVVRRWRVDRDYLDRARRTIGATERLPGLSLITGIHQTPYRVVRLAHA